MLSRGKLRCFLVYGVDLVRPRKDTYSALRVFLFEKVLLSFGSSGGSHRLVPSGRVSGVASLLKVYLEDFLEYPTTDSPELFTFANPGVY